MTGYTEGVNGCKWTAVEYYGGVRTATMETR